MDHTLFPLLPTVVLIFTFLLFLKIEQDCKKCIDFYKKTSKKNFRLERDGLKRRPVLCHNSFTARPGSYQRGPLKAPIIRIAFLFFDHVQIRCLPKARVETLGVGQTSTIGSFL